MSLLFCPDYEYAGRNYLLPYIPDLNKDMRDTMVIGIQN